MPAPGAFRLDIEGVGREESLRFVRRVFLSQEADTVRCAVFFRRRACSGHDMELRVRGTNACDHRLRVECALWTEISVILLFTAFFGVANSGGLALGVNTVRSSFPIFLLQLGDTNLWLLPSGAEMSDLSRYCTPLEMELRLTELRDQFDYVLIDSPPAQPIWRTR